jgi:Ca2+/H+ antiporter, TMEM165/GDT1 family
MLNGRGLPQIPVEDTDREKALMHYLAVIGIAFVVTFLAELPDKSMFASLVMGTRFRPSWVWAGAAAAFTVHMAIAVSAGQLLTLLPSQVVHTVVAGLFVAGAAYLLWSSLRGRGYEDADAARIGGAEPTFWRVCAASFGVVFLAEWGDITQITAANLAARYDALLVFIGATLGLWTVAAVAVSIGAKSLSLIPMPWVQRITATILLGLGIYTAVSAITA